MTGELQDLFAERERKILAGKKFLDDHTDGEGKISVDDAKIVEKFIAEVEELSMRISDELENRPTIKPVLMLLNL